MYSRLHLLAIGKIDDVSCALTHSYDNLGELQTAYQQFIVSWQQFIDYLVNGFYSHKKALLRNVIRNLEQMNESLVVSPAFVTPKGLPFFRKIAIKSKWLSKCIFTNS